MKNFILTIFTLITFSTIKGQEASETSLKYRFLIEIAPSLGVDKLDASFKSDFNFINSFEFPSTNSLGVGIGANYDFTEYVYVPIFADVRIKFNKRNKITPILVAEGGLVVYNSIRDYKNFSFYKVGFGFESRIKKKPIQMYLGYKGEIQEVIDFSQRYDHTYFPTFGKKKDDISYINFNFVFSL